MVRGEVGDPVGHHPPEQLVGGVGAVGEADRGAGGEHVQDVGGHPVGVADAAQLGSVTGVQGVPVGVGEGGHGAGLGAGRELGRATAPNCGVAIRTEPA